MGLRQRWDFAGIEAFTTPRRTSGFSVWASARTLAETGTENVRGNLSDNKFSILALKHVSVNLNGVLSYTVELPGHVSFLILVVVWWSLLWKYTQCSRDGMPRWHSLGTADAVFRSAPIFSSVRVAWSSRRDIARLVGKCLHGYSAAGP